MTINELSGKKSNEALVRQVFRTLLPIQILAAATPTLTSLLNGILIGNYLPQEAMVALGFVAPMTLLVSAFGAIISGGARILCGRYIGRGETKKLDYAFTASLLILAILGVVLTAVGLLASTRLALIFGAAGDTTAATAEYIRGIALGIIPTLMFSCLVVFLQMENESGFSLIATLVLAVSVLLYGLINLKFLGASIFGMGAASSLAQLTALVFVAVHIARSKKLMRLDAKGIDRSMVKDLCTLGFPAAFAMILYSLRNTLLNTIGLKIGGAEAVAALAILGLAAGPFDAINVGFGSVVSMFGSIIIGERDEKLLHGMYRGSLKIGLAIGLIKCAVMIVLARPMVILFGAEGTLIGTSAVLFMCYTLCVPFNIVTQVFVGIFQNLGKLRYMNVVYLFSAFIFPVATAFGLGNLIGEIGIWLCYGIAEILTVVIFYAVPMIKSRSLKPSFTRLILLDESFTRVPGYSITVNALENAVNSSEKVTAFCLENGIDSRRAKLCGLCAEELAVNIVTHGFTKTKRKSLSAEIFVNVHEGKIDMRIMDNAPRFDPAVKLGYPDPDDPCKNIGLRIVARIADDMEYRSTFGMNVLRVKL